MEGDLDQEMKLKYNTLGKKLTLVDYFQICLEFIV